MICELLKRESDETVASVEQLPAGANSVVYKIMTDQKGIYLAKRYITRKGDIRDRLLTEFKGLSFLWDNNIRSIPKPICLDRAYNVGIYAFIKGKKPRPGEVSEKDVKQAADFLREMHTLVNTKGSGSQPLASEACYSINGYVQHIEGRLNNLRNVSIRNDVFEEFHRYLNDEVAPIFVETKRFVTEEAKRITIDISEEIQRGERTLSPSDFGFHNVIKGDSGTLFFIDFEYYGWDDPAKLISDFYLQPAVPIPYVYRQVFFENIHEFIGREGSLVKRLPLVYRLVALKWCLIMLNVFRYHHKECNEEVLLRQLEKSKDKLYEIRQEFKTMAFPLSLN